MSFLGYCIVYSICLFGMGEMFIYFNGPFDILEKWRQFAHWIHPKFGELFTCIFCFTTWSGLIMSAVDYFLVTSAQFTPFNVILASTGLWWLVLMCDMFFGCGAVWLWHQIDEYIESKTEKDYEDE